MAKIFISYSIKDQMFVEELEKEFEKFDHTIYNIAKEFALGRTIKEKISETIKDSDVIVIIISKESLKSSWINYEVGYASSLAEHNNKPIIIPIVIDEIEINKLPTNLTMRQILFAQNMTISETAILLDDAIENLLGQYLANEEERQKVQLRVKNTATDYIKDSLSALQERERKYKNIAYFFYSIGFAILVASVFVAIWRVTNIKSEESNWISFGQIIFLVSVIIALFLAIAKYSYSLAKSFMVESLRNSDRIHAIKFGEFYLNAFAEKAKWEEVKEAFQHWNIDSGSAFIDQDINQIDPDILHKATEFIKSIKK